MTSENTALAIDLTQAILEQFWQQDTSLLLKYIDEHFSLTDALNHSIYYPGSAASMQFHTNCDQRHYQKHAD